MRDLTDPRPYRRLLARLLPSFGVRHARPIDTGWGLRNESCEDQLSFT